MGSTKDLIRDDSPAGRLYVKPTLQEFGIGAWNVKGTYSVRDLKELIPKSNIFQKPEILAMTAAKFFEWYSAHNWEPEICYIGMLDKSGRIVSVDELVDKGDKSNQIVMRLANTPESLEMNLNEYRTGLRNGTIGVGVADVESIFRQGLPLGSSFFEKLFKAAGLESIYPTLSTYDEVELALNSIRSGIDRDYGGKIVSVDEQGNEMLPKLEKVVSAAGIDYIPSPGLIMDRIIYNTTTKFEKSGDRDISREEAIILSGQSDEGYDKWTGQDLPRLAKAQIQFGNERGFLTMDGKMESVAYHGMPHLTDFACTFDENRLMITVQRGNELWAIPCDKEIARALYKHAGVDQVIVDAKKHAEAKGNKDDWKNYVPGLLKTRNIDLKAVSDNSCRLMEYAIAEVGNRILGKSVFETKPMEQWVPEFMPYASKITHASR